MRQEIVNTIGTHSKDYIVDDFFQKSPSTMRGESPLAYLKIFVINIYIFWNFANIIVFRPISAKEISFYVFPERCLFYVLLF